MYESLLDHDLEDETTVVVDVATDIDDKALDDEDETDGIVEADDTAARRIFKERIKQAFFKSSLEKDALRVQFGFKNHLENHSARSA